MSKGLGFNPRYVAYCKAMGEPDPDKMLAADRVKYQGGSMCGFILWISSKKSAFRKVSPQSFIGDAIADQVEWDKFLGVLDA